MRRTNIYLDDEQTAALDELARTEGTSRAEVIRRLVDRALGLGTQDSAGDMRAIEESFGVLDDAESLGREPDERSRHLDRLRRA